MKWPEEVWLNTETFYVNGVQVLHEAGKPVPENLAMSLRSIRREAPEFWAPCWRSLTFSSISSLQVLMMASCVHGRLSIRPSQPRAASGLMTALEEG